MEKIYAMLIVILLLLVIAYIIATFAIKNATYTFPNSVNFTLGVCTHGNESSELYALKHGIKYFRTDISNTQEQIKLLYYEHTLGANYLGILDYATLPGGIGNKNWNLSTWNTSVEEAVANYPWINTWEIWNEPYVSNFETGFMNGSAYNYYLIIRSASTIIKEHEPNATIVCFGGAPIGNSNIFYWYAEVWSYGASKYCDAISIHAYPQYAGLMNSNEINAWNQTLLAYEELTQKPIWITEIGMPASSRLLTGFSPSLQNEFMIQSFDLLNSMRFVKRVYWYDLWGLSDGAEENDFGLLNLSNPFLEPKPAWYTFMHFYNLSTHEIK